MPQLSDLVQKRKFVKKEYRPWNLSGSGTIDNQVVSHSVDNANNVIIKQEESTVENNHDLTANPVTETAIDFSKSDNKLDNKSGNDLDNNRVTNKQQSDNNQITYKQQPDNNQITNKEQTSNILDNVTGNNSNIVYLIDSVKKLTGIQKNIFYYVINICSARGALDTGNLLSHDLANSINCTIGSAKTSLIRLIEKKLIYRLKGKASRGGHMVLGITKEIQSAAIQAQRVLYNPLKMEITDNKLDNNPGNNISYSSSIYKNINTTSLPAEWKKINFEPLAHLGFSETQISQLYDCNATLPEIIQDSINRFAYSLEHNEKVKAYRDPLNVLMGILRKGQRWNEPQYTPAKELALREILEQKRKQKEKYDLMIKELVELEFPEWRKKLTKAEIQQIVPEETFKLNLMPAITATLRTYYIDHVLTQQLINHPKEEEST